MARLQERTGLVWELIEHHYGARNAFLAIHRAYEARVARLVADRGTSREKLKLTAAETKDLFDTWRLQALIRDHVEPLRAAAHALFRDNNVSDLYDSKVSRIYHELCVLNEEHLSVRNFPPDGPPREFARLFREVSEYYPERLRRVRDLFTRAQHRIDDLLPTFRTGAIVLRSVFLFRERLWPEGTTAGLTRFLARMFPDKGAAHGFLAIARSFFRAGFHEQAVECARMGLAVAARLQRASDASHPGESARKLERLLARAEAARAALEEQEA